MSAVAARPAGHAARTVWWVLYGRSAERRLIGTLIERARSECGSAVLVLRGAAGVGKSTLLRYAAEHADGLRVLRAHGVHSEAELPFAALHQLLRPLLVRANDLPAPQADALHGAFGLARPAGGDRWLVALGVLTLLSEWADERPVLCLIDDAQWLDRPTADTIRFVARRLAAEPIAVLIAVRADAEDAEDAFPEITRHTVHGLDDTAAVDLLGDRYPELAAPLRERIIRETGGNPLALGDLPGLLSPDQRAGREPLLGPLPLPEHLRRIYRRRFRALPEATRTVLLLAAAEERGELDTVLRAAGVLGVGADALDAAENDGLLRVADTVDGQRIVFRHPLVRAAAHRDLPSSRRRAAHRALAGALDPVVDPDRRTWHLAASTTGPDEDVARELEDSGERALRRGAPATAATTWERAAWLTASDTDRALRLVRAAEAANAAGHPVRAQSLAEQAQGISADPVVWARSRMLQATVAFDRGSPAAAHTLLLSGSAPITAVRPELAAAMLIDAVKNGWFMNDPVRTGDAARALAELDLPEDDPLWPRARTVLSLGGLVGGGVAGITTDTGRGSLHAMTRVHAEAGGEHDDAREVTDILGEILASASAIILGDDDGAAGSAGAAVTTCQVGGRVGWLPLALQLLASAEMLSGQHRFARAHATEGLELASTLEQDNRICHFRAVLAWLHAISGDEETTRELATLSLRHAEAQRIAPTAVIARWALGLSELGSGRYPEALEHLLPHGDAPGAHPLLAVICTPDLVESAIRAGHGDLARPHLARFDAWAAEIDRPWANAARARCHALLAEQPDAAEEHFLAALRIYERLGATAHPRGFDRARTELLYGEWLRRARRSGASRTPLTSAAETFDRLGAAPWARRARGELRAGGRSPRTPPRRSSTRSLTPQELQVVMLAAEGAGNREIGARLFLSPRTVAYHLYKAFPKLGVSSRTELVRVVLDDTETRTPRGTDTPPP